MEKNKKKLLKLHMNLITLIQQDSFYFKKTLSIITALIINSFLKPRLSLLKYDFIVFLFPLSRQGKEGEVKRERTMIHSPIKMREIVKEKEQLYVRNKGDRFDCTVI